MGSGCAGEEWLEEMLRIVSSEDGEKGKIGLGRQGREGQRMLDKKIQTINVDPTEFRVKPKEELTTRSRGTRSGTRHADSGSVWTKGRSCKTT
jgi:hypothetical protein